MKTLAHVVTGLPLDGHFDYWIPDELIGRVAAGQRVRVPFGRTARTGYVVACSSRSDVSGLKALDCVIEDRPVFPGRQLDQGSWMAAYYGCLFGEALEAMLDSISMSGHRRHNQNLSDYIWHYFGGRAFLCVPKRILNK